MGHTEQPREHTLSLHPILALASITPSTSRDLGAPLPLSLKLVPPSTPVQDNTVLPSLLDVRPRINPLSLYFLLHQPSRDWDTQQHHWLVLDREVRTPTWLYKKPSTSNPQLYPPAASQSVKQGRYI